MLVRQLHLDSTQKTRSVVVALERTTICSRPRHLSAIHEFVRKEFWQFPPWWVVHTDLLPNMPSWDCQWQEANSCRRVVAVLHRELPNGNGHFSTSVHRACPMNKYATTRYQTNKCLPTNCTANTVRLLVPCSANSPYVPSNDRFPYNYPAWAPWPNQSQRAQ